MEKSIKLRIVDVDDNSCTFSRAGIAADCGILDSKTAVHGKNCATFILSVVRGSSAGVAANDVVFTKGAVLNRDAA